MAYLNNVRLEDHFKILDKKSNRECLYHGDPDIIKPVKTRLRRGKYTRPLAATILGLNNTSIPLSDDHDTKNFWTDHDALESYLNSKPTCYLMLGIGGCGIYSIADAFSKKHNCIHLNPKHIILDEIGQNKNLGKCIDFNLRHNKVCKYNVIFKMLKQKVQSPAVKHRGYIISGLPLVDSNTEINYVNHKLTGEEAYCVVESIIQDMLNFQNKRKIFKSQSTNSSIGSDVDSVENFEEEDELEKDDQDKDIDVESFQLLKFILNPCNNVITFDKIYRAKKCVIFDQIKDLFMLNPDVIINVSCPYNDLGYRRNHKYYNYMENTREYNQYPAFNNNIDIRWPPSYMMHDLNITIDSRNFNPKYNCKHPINFDENIFKQICNYKEHVNRYIEERFKEFNPYKILNLDGRVSLAENIHNIHERLLLMMNVSPVIIPKPLYLNHIPDNIEDLWNNVEKIKVLRSDALKCNRHSSPWYNRCPIELHSRRSIQGNIKYSVTFYKYVFLLSSLHAMSLFCKNPRPYLKLNDLEPTCRVIIIGTKSSGKSMIAKCLSWIFETPIICYAQFLQELKRKKYNKYSNEIFTEIIATIEDKRLAKWESNESGRKSKLSEWLSEMIIILKQYVELVKKRSMIGNEPAVSKIDEENMLNNYRRKLSFLPFLDDSESCENALKNDILLEYAPSNLTKEQKKLSPPSIGDEDVVQEIYEYILSNNLEREVLPSTQEIMSDVITMIKSIDLKSIHNKKEFGKFIIDGFPSDLEFWEHLNDSKLLPDYTIAIFENREVDSDLINHYETIEKSVKSYYDRIILGTDTLIKTKLDHSIAVDTNTPYIEFLLESILQTAFSKYLNEAQIENNLPEKIQTFTEAINSFRENWDLLKLKLDENYKSFVEIEIDESKSDIQVLDEILLKIRKCYRKPGFTYIDEVDNEEEDKPNDILYFNDAKNLGYTNVYCPSCFYNFGVLWKGKGNFSIKYDDRVYYFNSEECCDTFQNDPTKYQQSNAPFKIIPPIRICIVGCIGSGKSTIAKKIAKELGLLHVDFDYFINTFLLPRHFKRVGWKYENSFNETSIEEEIETEILIDEENVDISEMFANENEFRRIIQNYFEQGIPLPSMLMEKLLYKLWRDIPFLNTGVVIDGFPKSLTDVENMLACFAIPDLVIDLEGAFETTLERLSPHFTDTWYKQCNQAKLKAEIDLKNKHDKWMQFVTSTVIAKVTIEIILDIVCKDSEKLNETISTKSTFSDEQLPGTTNEDPTLINIYNDLIREYPEPLDETEWQTFDDAYEKINSRWERNFEVNDENIKAAKEHLQEQNINVLSVNGQKSDDKVLRNVLSKLTILRNRCESFLEQTFVVSIDDAEMLLLEGFLFLSKFRRLCPVYIFENSSTILHTYYLCKKQGRLYPVIHRPYIYFISSEENVIKFRNNPLMYMGTNVLKSYQQYPIRIAVIGPPKSGKSKLTSKLGNRYGLMCISKGMAIRYILTTMRWTELGSRIDDMIRNGTCIDNELIMKSVLIVLMDFRANTNGFVFDGFPETPYECCELLNYGINPAIIFYLNSNAQTLVSNSQREVCYNIIKEKPPYSKSFITNRYNSWNSKSKLLSDWIKQDTQNMYVINSNNSQWQCHSDVIKIIESVILKINHYLRNVNNKAVSVSVFGISNKCFEKKMSCFKHICPVCFRNNVVQNSGYPPDKNGLIQYKDKFYWICPEHLEHVLNYSSILESTENVKIPDIPTVVKDSSKPLLYEDGVCLVTYAENLPSQKIINGNAEYAAVYKGKTYLFCTSECLNKFLTKPHLYYDVIVFKQFKSLPKLSLKSLPNLGYLEQTIGNIITDACCAVNVLRPKYPGIDIRLSALLYIGLYLKTFNPVVDESVAAIYKKSLKSFEYRSRLLTSIGSRFRSMQNPFVSYPQCCHNKEDS